ncbi:MAG: hypothetical protein Rhirs2KO_18410 [Rhizobiaceae bacterium]
MDNPGIKELGTVALAAINAATTATVVTSASDANGQTQAYLDRMEGMLAASIEANFTYGSSGGDTLKVMVETSLDQGQTWIEVARLAFAQASAQKVVNLSGLTPVTAVYAPAALSDDTVKDGIFGLWFRASILKGGGAAYAGNTALSIRMIAR